MAVQHCNSAAECGWNADKDARPAEVDNPGHLSAFRNLCPFGKSVPHNERPTKVMTGHEFHTILNLIQQFRCVNLSDQPRASRSDVAV